MSQMCQTEHKVSLDRQHSICIFDAMDSGQQLTPSQLQSSISDENSRKTEMELPVEKPPIQTPAIYMLRNIHMHNIMLTDMADRKANFLLAATMVSLTIVVNLDFSQYQYTILAMSGFAILIVLSAVMTIIPKYKMSAELTKEYPLFFGSFGKRDFADFYNDVDKIIRCSDSIYETLSKDLYGVGKVLLNKKYVYLNFSYRMFLLGIIVVPILLCLEKQNWI